MKKDIIKDSSFNLLKEINTKTELLSSYFNEPVWIKAQKSIEFKNALKNNKDFLIKDIYKLVIELDNHNVISGIMNYIIEISLSTINRIFDNLESQNIDNSYKELKDLEFNFNIIKQLIEYLYCYFKKDSTYIGYYFLVSDYFKDLDNELKNYIVFFEQKFIK